MNLTPVESSHIAAIGYLEAERVLLVLYRDGALYARPEWEAHRYKALMESESKGRFLNSFKGPAILISKGGDAVCDQSTRAAPAVESGPLNVLDEDAGKCCAKAFRILQAKDSDQFVCADCGADFLPEMRGPIRYWRIVPQVVIVRRG